MVIVLLVSGVIFLVFWGRDLISPGGSRVSRMKVGEGYRVVGFLPTWMIGKTMNYCDQLTEMVFLGVEVGVDGSLVWDGASSRLKGDSYKKMKDDFSECGGKNIMGIKLFDDDVIAELLASEQGRINLVAELKELIKEEEFDGLNVDFEYQGNPLAVLDDDFVGFIRQLKEADLGQISVDVFANTIIKGGEEVKLLLDELDYLIVMAYDFHRPGMDYAGPVAPIRSAMGERNIWEVVEEVVESGLDKKKIVMAYPLYGYEWKTETREFGSRVKRGWWALASYRRMKEMDAGERFWDDQSMTPWLVYEEEGEIKQIYYENLESLSRKFELIYEAGLAGVGFWALGYEGDYGEVWEELVRVLN